MNTSFVQARYYTSGRLFQKVDKIVIHWIGGYLSGADSQFTKIEPNPDLRRSAHFAVEAETVHQYVRLQDTAWHASNWLANLRSIGIEHSAQPGRDASDATYETSSQLISQICKQLGLTPSRQLLHKHSEFKATACPGTMDLDRLAKRALELFQGTVRVPWEADIDVPASPPIQGQLASAPVRHVFNFNLSPGTVGEEVGLLQDRLILLGYVDDIAGMRAGRGTYGPRTSQAVVKFQLRNGVIRGIGEYGAGYFGPKTRSVINNLSVTTNV